MQGWDHEEKRFGVPVKWEEVNKCPDTLTYRIRFKKLRQTRRLRFFRASGNGGSIEIA
jgi:hypothetical protein